jgi:molybdate transport repressor ModE-like protein
MKINWDDMRTILALVRGGSLAIAAQDLGVTYTTVARRVQRVEDLLGRPLFERRPEGYSAMNEARDLAAAAARMEAQEHQVMRQLAGRDQSLAGPLVLTAPQLLIQYHLAPLIASFSGLYPDIELTVRATNEVLDLARREADLALRISASPGDSLVGHRLCGQRNACFATEAIATAAAQDPDAQLSWVIYSGYDKPPNHALVHYSNYRVRGRFDDMTAMVAAARAGMGAVRMPLFLARSHPDLVPLAGLSPQDYAPIWVLSHRDLMQSSKTRLLKDEIRAYFRKHHSQFAELPDLSPRAGDVT